MDEKKIQVTREEQFATYKQTVTPKSKDEVIPVMLTLHDAMAKQKFTGIMTVHYNCGGVRNFVTEQIAQIKPGTEADRALESVFGGML